MTCMSATQSIRGEMFLRVYKVVGLLGEGGMGKAFLGRHVKTGQEVVIKVMRDELAKKAAEPLHIYGADWIEEDAIKAGFFFTDLWGIKHGTRPPSPDPAVLANPVTQEQIDAEAAVAVAATTSRYGRASGS